MKLAEIKKIKVAELRVMLRDRGLDAKGLKAELVDRLWSAISAESPAKELGDAEASVGGAVEEKKNESRRTSELSVKTEANIALLDKEAPSADSELAVGSGAPPVARYPDDGKPHKTFPRIAVVRLPAELVKGLAGDSAKEAAATVAMTTRARPKPEMIQEVDVAKENPQGLWINQHPHAVAEAETIGPQECTLSDQTTISEDKLHAKIPPSTVEPSSPPQTDAAAWEAPAQRPEPLPERRDAVDDDDTNGDSQSIICRGPGSDNGSTETANFSTVAQKGSDSEMVSGPESEDEPREASGSQEPAVPGGLTQTQDRGIKRPHGACGRGRSYYEFKEEIQYNRAKPPEPETHTEEEEELDEGLVMLDSYYCDVHFEVDGSRRGGQPRFWDRFPLLRSGGRLTHGMVQGRGGFEAKLVKKLTAEGLDIGEKPPHVLRVGWSMDKTSLQLGEVDLSYGYDGQGTKITDGKEEEFGEPFSEGDVIGCYASISEEEVELSFLKNGVPVGVAFHLRPSPLGGHALFPHVLCQSCSVTLNLEPSGAPWYPYPEGFAPIHALPAQSMRRGPLPPSSKQDCEVLMMVGMPGAGKTHWAQAHMAQNPEKRYSLLSTVSLLACMRASGQKELMLQQASQCLTQLIRSAPRQRRNYILDQANVYPSARRHKLLCFGGFRRKAVVVCPSDEEWRRRLKEHQAEEGEEVPDTSLLKVKVSFSLPEEDDLLEEVLFPEMSREETHSLLNGYKEEARKLLPSVPKHRKRQRPQRGRAPHGAPPRDSGYGWNAGGWSQRPQRWGHLHAQENRFYGDVGQFYGRSYEPDRYREYHRQYVREWDHSCQGHYNNRNYGYGGSQGHW